MSRRPEEGDFSVMEIHHAKGQEYLIEALGHDTGGEGLRIFYIYEPTTKEDPKAHWVTERPWRRLHKTLLRNMATIENALRVFCMGWDPNPEEWDIGPWD